MPVILSGLIGVGNADTRTFVRRQKIVVRRENLGHADPPRSIEGVFSTWMLYLPSHRTAQALVLISYLYREMGSDRPMSLLESPPILRR